MCGSDYGSHFKGGISIDEGDIRKLRDLAVDNEIDVERYLPVGMEFYLGTNGIISSSVVTIDTSKHGIPGQYDNVKEFIEKNDPVPVVKFNLEKGMDDFLTYIKRVHIVFERKGIGLYGKQIM